MKFALEGKDTQKVERLSKEIEGFGYKISENPDIVISVGGDGSFLIAERRFPGIPKLAVRDKKSLCRLCHNEVFENAVKVLAEGRFTIKEYPKVEAVTGKKKLVAANEITVRNKDVFHAIRFNVRIAGKEYDNLIGDGIVVSTAFGSTGYFFSITKKSFDGGFGLAFNNLTTKEDYITMHEPEIEMKILRNPAQVSADNDPDIIEVNKDDIILFRRSDEVLRVISPEV